jgi:electron transport complex protein RnfG
MAEKGGYLKQGWLVLLLALIFGSALAAVHVAWNPLIEANRENLARERIPYVLGIDADAPIIIEKQKIEAQTTPPKTYQAYAVFEKVVADGKESKGEMIGWAVPASGQGFADRISVLIGLDARCRLIRGIYVLDQKETPGLGDNITLKQDSVPVDATAWVKSFAGKKAIEPLDLKRHGEKIGEGDIEAVSGATVSSQAVTNIVNETVANLRPLLPGKADELCAPAPTTAPADEDNQE